MTRPMVNPNLCRQFSALLSYPDADLSRTTAACLEQLRPDHPEAAEQLQAFADFLATANRSRVEEVFTATFDLQPLCHPYLGYQLCGESQQRTMFLLELKRLYREHGFIAGGELPDHLAQVLDFLAVAGDEAVRAELLNDGLRPALDKLLTGFDDPQHPYRALLGALQALLNETGTAGAKEVAS
jgi:nitrate reductase molybdenum cofactor assembly chaperone NarJ/NarW